LATKVSDHNSVFVISYTTEKIKVWTIFGEKKNFGLPSASGTCVRDHLPSRKLAKIESFWHNLANIESFSISASVTSPARRISARVPSVAGSADQLQIPARFTWCR